MRALITGAGGFVGEYLAKELLKNGFEVCGIDLVTKDLPGCQFVQADILDKSKLQEVFSQVNPTHVFHLAAQSSVRKSFEQPEMTMKVNVEGTRNVLQMSGNAKILLVCSADAYGNPAEFPIKETAPLHPISPYGESRVKQEQMAQEMSGKHIVIARSFNHTGPGQSAQFVCSDFAKQIAEAEKGKREKITAGDLSVQRDFSDVRDVVRAYRLLLEKAAPEVYNVCSGISFSIKDIFEKLVSFSTVKITPTEDQEKTRKHDIPKLLGDNSKLRDVTGWQPSFSFDQTLQDVLEYWRSHS